MVYKKICFLTITCLMLNSSLTLSNTQLNAKNEHSSKTEKNGQFDNTPKNNTSYIFRIKYPELVKKQPSLRAYYKGYKYDIGNMGIISHQSESNTLFLVITDHIKHKFENDKIQYLERIENNPCRAFFLSSKTSAHNPETIEWQIEEEKTQNIPLRLPEDALVVLLDSNLVEEVKDNPSKFVQDFKKNLEYNSTNNTRSIIYLPELCIKKTITQTQIDLAATYASLCSIDLDAIHVSPTKEIKIERERIVELAPGQHLS